MLKGEGLFYGLYHVHASLSYIPWGRVSL